MKYTRKLFVMKILSGFAVFAFLLVCATSVFAEESSAEKGYTYNLKKLMELAEKNIEMVDKALKEKEIEERNQKRATEARDYFEKGNALYKEGKLKEAKKAWQNSLRLSRILR